MVSKLPPRLAASRLLLALLTASLVQTACDEPSAPSNDAPLSESASPAFELESFSALLTYEGLPEEPEDWSFAVFADQGAWTGFALRPADSPQPAGFSGPFLMTRGRWLGPGLSLTLIDAATGKPIPLEDASIWTTTAEPGLLRSVARVDDLTITLELWFEVSGTALMRADIHNSGSSPRQLTAGWIGSFFAQQGGPETIPDGARHLTIRHPDYEDEITLDFGPVADVRPAIGLDIDLDPKAGPAETWTLRTSDTAKILAPGASLTRTAAWRHRIGAEEHRASDSQVQAWLTAPDTSLQRRQERWQGYADAVLNSALDRDDAKILAVKAVQTLRGNLRRPAGRINYEGIFPSSNIWYFNGFWAWDSWKHAVGTALFDIESAKNQVRLMFEFQDEHGMIADVVYLDASEDNWRDTKPPLAGWAVETLHRRDGDLAFVRELYPKLVAYHEFWYADRDHDGDGLCEYGSTDGTLVAARWESGMDNAVRFDDTAMLKNNDHAWSMDQESVDLNSYLYRDKLALAYLAEAQGLNDDAERFAKQAEVLGERIRDVFFDAESGWFYDVNIESGEPVSSGGAVAQGPEGWIPLWAGVASEEQAARVRDGILSTETFRTHVPFPTVSKAHPGYSDGYWRGLVWLDQAYFAIEGLRRYGFHEDADGLRDQLFANLEGAVEPGVPLRENYHPETGAGHNANHFSWTAAHLLLLTQEVSP